MISFFILNYFFKKKINLNIINFFTIILILICLFNYFKKNLDKDLNINKNIFTSNNFDFKNLKNKPDIYHIIPDGLLNISQLEKYGYTESNDLKKSLKDLNLEYYENSQTNYPTTFFSLASTLNGSLIKEDIKFDEKQIYKNIYNSKFHNLLLENDYKIFWYKTKWLGSRCNYKKYICMNNEFYKSEIFSTYLQILNFNFYWIDKIFYKLTKRNQLMHLDIITEDLKKIHKSKNPKYIFGYINLPHGPYTVDKNCTPIIQKNIKKNIVFKKKQYFEHVECFQKQLKNFTLQIEKNYNKNNFIIIVQSDTGWSFNSNLVNEGRPVAEFPDRVWPNTYFKNFLSISKNLKCISNKNKISSADLFPIIVSCLNNKNVNLNNLSKFDVYYSDHPKHGKIYQRKDLE